MIDAHGVIRNVPAQSMLTGLLANALGWTRAMRAEHQALQERIVFGVVWERDVAHSRMTDYQTAQLGKSDRAWTTRGVPAGRAGGAGHVCGRSSTVAGLSRRPASCGRASARPR